MATPSLPSDQRGASAIRSRLFALPALLVVVALIVAAAPTEAGTRRVALGVWDPDGNRNMSVYDEFKKAVGRQPAVVTVNSQWGNPDSRAFPVKMANKAKARGARLMVTWSPVGPPPLARETGKYSRWKRIIAGKHDRYIKSWARAVKRHGAPVFIRFAHEVNASYFPWTEGWGKFYNPTTGKRDVANDNTAQRYKKAWRRVYNLFRKVGAKNAIFLWTLAKKTCPGGCNPFAKWDPGDAYFQYAGFSTFNWAGFNGRPWETFNKGLKQPMRNMLKSTRRPVIVAEVGTSDTLGPNGETKADWIRQGYPAVYRAYPKVRIIVYQDVDFTTHGNGHPNWSITGSQSAINAYKKIVSQNRFKGRITKRGGVR